MVLLAPGTNAGEDHQKNRPKESNISPDQEKILLQARYILRLTNIIRDLKKQIQILLSKPEIQHLNYLEIKLTTKNRELNRLKILALIGVSLGLIGTIPNCVTEVEKSASLLTEVAK